MIVLHVSVTESPFWYTYLLFRIGIEQQNFDPLQEAELFGVEEENFDPLKAAEL
jgi:hypothetical protein